MRRDWPPRLRTLEAHQGPRARRLAEFKALSPEARRAKIVELAERLDDAGPEIQEAGRRLAAKLGIDL